jgi:excisionase family DNA binding protein
MNSHTSTQGYAAERSERLLSAVEVAELIGCHPQTVYRMADRGELTRIHVGPRLVRYAKSELDQFLPEKNERPAPKLDARDNSAMARRHEPS